MRSSRGSPTGQRKHDDFLPHPGALGRRYSDLKQYEKARVLLEQYVAESPEYWAFERLAKNYREQGDAARWLATLDRYLAAGEDHGLDHAKVRVEIANDYMAKGLWTKAQPYAEAAAATWAAWAMQCAVRCYEGMQDWQRAELWVRRLSERYPDSSLREWLKFCKRTGHGDIAAARALLEQYGVDPGKPEATDFLEVGYSAWLKGSTKEAMDSIRKAYESKPSLLAGCALLVLADEMGDGAQRDAILNDASHQASGRRRRRCSTSWRCSAMRSPTAIKSCPTLRPSVALSTKSNRTYAEIPSFTSAGCSKNAEDAKRQRRI